jgi:hypothetical protein
MESLCNQPAGKIPNAFPLATACVRLLELASEPGGAAAEILADLGVGQRELRAEVMSLVGGEDSTGIVPEGLDDETSTGTLWVPSDDELDLDRPMPPQAPDDRQATGQTSPPSSRHATSTGCWAGRMGAVSTFARALEVRAAVRAVVGFAHRAPSSDTEITIFPRACPSSRYRMASGTSLSGYVLSMIGVISPPSRRSFTKTRSFLFCFIDT